MSVDQKHHRFIPEGNARYTCSTQLQRSVKDYSSASVQAYFDLSMSRNLLEKFPELIIRRCLEKRLVLEGRIKNVLLLTEVLHPSRLYF